MESRNGLSAIAAGFHGRIAVDRDPGRRAARPGASLLRRVRRDPGPYAQGYDQDLPVEQSARDARDAGETRRWRRTAGMEHCDERPGDIDPVRVEARLDEAR